MIWMQMSSDSDRPPFRTRPRGVWNTDQKQDRGQIEGRHILGAIIVIVVVGPLTATAIDIQASLAILPQFSWLSGAIIAILIVAAMLAAALGLDGGR